MLLTLLTSSLWVLAGCAGVNAAVQADPSVKSIPVCTPYSWPGVFAANSYDMKLRTHSLAAVSNPTITSTRSSVLPWLRDMLLTCDISHISTRTCKVAGLSLEEIQ